MGSAGARPVVLIAGTRPEAIKLLSLWSALRDVPTAAVRLWSSGQHPQMVRQALAPWGLAPDAELAPVAPGVRSLMATVRELRDRVARALEALPDAVVVVQGDTSTAYAGALAAHRLGRTLVHVEAGLRTADPLRPFPEEVFRRRIARLAHWHYAPTAAAVRHLLDEGIPAARIALTGNTGVDALRLALALPQSVDPQPEGTRLLVLTVHRRENAGARLVQICTAVRTLLELHPDLRVVCPVHPNPAIAATVRRCLGAHPAVDLRAPMDYAPFVQLLARATLVLTDSGGVQEEAPYLGLPVLVIREQTERPEALMGGGIRLVPAEAGALVAAAQALLQAQRPAAWAFDAQAAFGDGWAGPRIAAAIGRWLRDPEYSVPPAEPAPQP